MPKSNLDGIYKLSVALGDEEDFGPPDSNEDLDDTELEEVGTFQISGDKVTALDGDVDHLQELIGSAFRREGEKKGSVYIDKQVSVKNGSPGFAHSFLQMLEFLDYDYEKMK